MALVPLLLTGMRVGEHNARHGEAQRLAGEAMVALQVADYDALPAFDGLPSAHGRIVLQRTVESDVPAPGQTRLTVTATWHSGAQRHRYQLQSLRGAP